MQAVILTQYGPPAGLQLAEIDKPTPKDNQVLVKIHATTVTAGDCEVRTLQFPLHLLIPIRLYVGLIRPRNFILGQELAGEVEAVGKNVTRFKPGDAVFGTAGAGFGAYAEYKCLPADSEDVALAPKPANLSYAEAAAVPIAGLEALHFLRRAGIQPGQKVLINGASGGIGAQAVQLAKHFGAEVTGVCGTPRVEFVKALGADHVIDYTREDYTQREGAFDVILDVIGKSAFSGSLRALKPGGRFLLINSGLVGAARARWATLTTRKRVILGSALHRTADLLHLKALLEAGHIKSIIDRTFPLEQTADAHRYAESGQKKGNVAITVTG